MKKQFNIETCPRLQGFSRPRININSNGITFTKAAVIYLNIKKGDKISFSVDGDKFFVQFDPKNGFDLMPSHNSGSCSIYRKSLVDSIIEAAGVKGFYFTVGEFKEGSWSLVLNPTNRKKSDQQ